jgi:hypothetical protein
MKQKGNVAIMSVLVALVALVILILSLSYIIMAQPEKNADVKNVINPLDQNPQSNNVPNFITYTNVDRGSSSDSDPSISIPDITIIHGQVYTIDLDSHSSDDEDSHSDLDFDINYNPTFTPAPITLSFNDVNNVLTITEVNGSWTGTQSITIEVEDTDDNLDEDTFTVTISAPAVGVPVISSLPDITFGSGGTDNSLDLNIYVTDSDHLDSELTWTFSGNTNVNVAIGAGNIVTFTSAWIGSELVTFRVTDPLGNFAQDTILVTVTAFNAPAVWNTLSNQNINEDSAIGTVVYTNILGQCSDVDSPIVMSINSTNFGFVLGITGNDLILNAIQPNWWGTQTVVMECNGVLTSFGFTVNRILDDCITVPTNGVDYLYCD